MRPPKEIDQARHLAEGERDGGRRRTDVRWFRACAPAGVPAEDSRAWLEQLARAAGPMRACVRDLDKGRGMMMDRSMAQMDSKPRSSRTGPMLFRARRLVGETRACCGINHERQFHVALYPRFPCRAGSGVAKWPHQGRASAEAQGINNAECVGPAAEEIARHVGTCERRGASEVHFHDGAEDADDRGASGKPALRIA